MKDWGASYIPSENEGKMCTVLMISFIVRPSLIANFPMVITSVAFGAMAFNSLFTRKHSLKGRSGSLKLKSSADYSSSRLEMDMKAIPGMTFVWRRSRLC